MEGANQKGITGGGANDGCNQLIYLVACHSDWLRISKPYIMYKMDVAAGASSPLTVILECLKPVARLKCVGGGKTVISVRSRRCAWIVGVGDTETRKVIYGPDLKSPMWLVLTVVGAEMSLLEGEGGSGFSTLVGGENPLPRTFARKAPHKRLPLIIFIHFSPPNLLLPPDAPIQPSRHAAPTDGPPQCGSHLLLRMHRPTACGGARVGCRR